MITTIVADSSGLTGTLQVNDTPAVVFDASGITSGFTLGVRQTVQSGSTTGGYASMLSSGSGLALNLAATTVPMKTAFAAGVQDYVSTLSSDTSSVVSVPASALSFISQDYVSPTSVTWNSTLAQPQYGYLYVQNSQSVLQFGGSAGSTTFLDDFGNTWVAQGGAKVQTNQVKFGTGALGGGGTSNALNGSSDYLKSTSFTSLGKTGWSLRAWVNPTVLPASTFLSTVVGACNDAKYGVEFGVYNNAGTYSFSAWASSTGTSWDIASGITAALVPVVGTWYFVEFTFDAVAGVYRLYVNGTQLTSATSSSVICPITSLCVGAQGGTTPAGFFTGYIDKFEYLPYCQHPNGVGYAVPTQAPNVATQGYASDWFSIPLMTMYQVSSASGVSGTNPTFTAKNRVYVGETTAGVTGISSVVNYALNGRYDSGLFAVAASTVYSKTHNIGTVQYTIDPTIADDVSGTNERVPTQISGSSYGYYGATASRNQFSLGFSTNVGVSTASAAITSGFFRIKTRRSF